MAQWALLVLMLLCVSGARAQDETPQAFAQVSVTPQSVFVGQRLVYTLRVYTQGGEFTIPALVGDGIWLDAAPQNSSTSAQVNGMQYIATDIVYNLYPLQAGPLTITAPPIEIEGTVFTADAIVDVPPVMLEVRALPGGAPESFSGAVGRFSAARTVDSAPTIYLGDPITLRVEISGVGNFETMARPPLPLPEGWRAYERPAAGDIQRDTLIGLGRRAFEWRLIADSAGAHVFPPMTFSYFEPDALAYQTVTLPELRIDVLQARDGTRETQRFDRASLNRALPLKTLTGGTAGGLDVIYWAWWLVPPLAVLGAWVYARAHAAQQAQARLLRRTQAILTARDRLSRALNAPSPAVASALIEAAVLGYFADKLGEDQVDAEAVQAALRVRTVDEALRARVADVHRLALDVRYAPDGVIDFSTVIARAVNVLTAVEAVWHD